MCQYSCTLPSRMFRWLLCSGMHTVPCIHYIFLVMQPLVLLFKSLPALYLMVSSLPPSLPPALIHRLPIFTSHPDLSLPAAIGSSSPTAAAGAEAAMLGGWQVLVHGPAVWDEAQAQLEMSGQPAVRGQCQNQQRGDQEEAHHQEGHAASVSQQV